MPQSSSNTGDGRSNLGQLAEHLVAQWLKTRNCEILQQRWHSRWGELDLVALKPSPSPGASPTLIFVEVKARSDRNWDENGLLAITPQKQAKLWQTAELFLAAFPDLGHLPCRFDVALVVARRRKNPPVGKNLAPPPAVEQPDLASTTIVTIGKAVAIAQYHLTLKQYIPNAFALT